MEKTESESSRPENLAEITDKSSEQNSEKNDYFSREIFAQKFPGNTITYTKIRMIKLGILEIILSIVLGISEYWLWLHWVIVNYDYALNHGTIIVHLFRINTFGALCTIILIGIALLCVIDAIRRIILSTFRM